MMPRASPPGTSSSTPAPASPCACSFPTSKTIPRRSSQSSSTSTYHNYLSSLAAAAGVLAVSVDYRLAPEHPLPAAYDDCWAALRWAVSSARDNDDEWAAAHGDTARVFVAGDSAGGNIVHNVLVRAAGDELAPRIEGAVLLHPFFGGSAVIDGETERAVEIAVKVWGFACPDAVNGADDPRINPAAPGLERLGCDRMLVCAAEKDWLAPRVRAYYGAVTASAWRGSAAWLETEGEEHVFFLLKPECDRAKALMDRVVAFIAAA
ncbi:hypothetical protein PR202_ga15619 [Eleusine coracana subsp. coracana]|uniref:Alpha/beta hydrolase fold-3 domain-containing protein n=1 Tax=Eleusine coracana subsp. coracana TaxID=191504 RepID=A0AAV5CKC0_ELECO|nr:hypothetical protein PR202_ga15619 [Eleusine coracana subsp. coracana]